MLGNLPEVMNRIRSWNTETSGLPWKIYGPAEPESISMDQNRIHIVGLVRGSSRKNLSTDAVGIITSQNSARIALVDGIPAADEEEQQKEREYTRKIAQAITDSPVGTWPKEQIMELGTRGSIITDVFALENDNYLVGSIGAMDTFSVAFVPNEDGTFNRNSVRLIYANPLIEPDISQVDQSTGKLDQKHMKNPHLMPNGTILFSSTFNGLQELAKLYGLEKHLVITNPEILQSKNEADPALKGFFSALLINIEEYGLPVLNKVLTLMAETKSYTEDITCLFTVLSDKKIPPQPKGFLPVGNEFMLLNELIKSTFTPDADTMRYHPLAMKYGMSTVNLLIEDILKNNLEKDDMFKFVLERARSLAPAQFLPDVMKRRIHDQGISIHQASKFRMNTEHTTPQGMVKAVVQRENFTALKEHLNYDWEIFGVGKQFSRILEDQRTYSGEFRNLLGMDIPEFLNQRKKSGLSTHGIDIMGPGLIEGQNDFDSMTAVTIKSENKNKQIYEINGNILSRKIWSQIKQRAIKTKGYDVAICRPVGPFQRTIMPNIDEDPNKYIDAELVMFKALLFRTYEILSDRDGTLLLTLPNFQFVGFGDAGNDKSVREYANQKMGQFLHNLEKAGIDIKLNKSDFKKGRLHVCKIIKHKSSLKKLPQLD